MLDIINFNKRYNTEFSFCDISLHLGAGDFTLLFGSDDAGKTALIYHILGLHHFQDGEILFQGKPVQSLSIEERKAIRFVPDSVCMEHITAREYFVMIASTYKDYEQEDIVDMCEYFGVDMDTKLTDMTYNENKLTMIIGALVTAPKLLILDEPMNFLTQESNMKLLSYLKFLSSRGITVLVTSSEAKEVKDYCTNYIYMKERSIAFCGTMRDIYGSQKAVTVKGGEQSLIQSLLGVPIAKANDRATYLYDRIKQSRSLAEIVSLIGNTDIEMENLTLEEILDKDYTRWM